MIVELCQRWTRGRASYRPAGEPIDPRAYEVAEIPDDVTARNFVRANHYSGTFVAAVRRFGLYRGGELVGVAVYSVVWDRVTRAAGLVFSGVRVLELSRLVLLDRVEANGESWFLARTRALLRDAGELVLSHADDIARTDVAGARVFPGHVGTCYQASNAVFLGRARSNTLYLLADGTSFSQRAQSKIRSREQGWRYASRILEAYGAEPLGETQDARAWLTKWREALCRRLRHPGCLRYVWPLERALERHLPASLPYPKLDLPRPSKYPKPAARVRVAA